MAIDYKNKYMQVFQDYNEFSEHSADYVRGEDHIAFLIEENEVIYWLYLEQVWRPLNVRTIQTGTLEDGRTKVAVRLEYIEGGQKYTAVPNIPDPERITSMSHFLEDYPDIEEVNVSGTVNLTDLSYAFAGSKIKDFSMLDTSNVTTINNMLSKVRDENKNIIFKVGNITNNDYFENLNLKTLDITVLNYHADKFLKIENRSIIDYLSAKDVDIEINNSSVNKIYCNRHVKITGTDGTYNRNVYVENINCSNITLTVSALSISNKLTNISCNFIEVTDDFSDRTFDNAVVYLHDCNQIKYTFKGLDGFDFGKGIDYSNINNLDIIIDTNKTIGNFVFTTPIVDDAFYAKYNHKISIFQYKTTFTEVADVNISSEVDSSLLYSNCAFNNPSFDTSELSIEIYNKIYIELEYNKQRKYKKFIIDNTELELSDDDLPIIYNPAIYAYDSNAVYDKIIAEEECRISGKYNCNNDSIADSIAFKDITFYNCPIFVIRHELTNRNINFNNCANIQMDAYIDGQTFDISKLIDKENNNIINSILTGSNTYHVANASYFLVDYIENKQIIINYKPYNNWGSIAYLCWFLNYYDNTSQDNPIIIKNICSLCYNEFNINNDSRKEAVYIDCQDDGILDLGTNVYEYNSHVNNIYGNVVLRLYDTAYNGHMILDANIKHIDIKKVILKDASTRYEMFDKTLDEESTINLVTKLVDNTGNSSITIYMYRSQANIIGEENIAAAVAKNYEFAIIEN